MLHRSLHKFSVFFFFFNYMINLCNVRNLHNMFAELVKERKNIPTGTWVKSAILFSIFLTVLSRPLAKRVPKLVLSLNSKEQVKTGFNFKWKAEDILLSTLNSKDTWSESLRRENPRPASFNYPSFSFNNGRPLHVWLGYIDQIFTFLLRLWRLKSAKYFNILKRWRH